MQQNKNNINLKSIKDIISWDTEKILAYKKTIEEYVSQNYIDEINAEKNNNTIQKIKNYQDELEKILIQRKQI
jgi:hypothetical protein